MLYFLGPFRGSETYNLLSIIYVVDCKAGAV
jgi:hypothetical protein